MANLKLVRQAFRIRRKGSSSSVEEDERYLVGRGFNGGTSSGGGESSDCDGELSPNALEGKYSTLNAYGRLAGSKAIDIEDDDETGHQPQNSMASESNNRKPGSSSNEGKNKNQRMR